MAKQMKILVAGLGSRWGLYAEYVRKHPDDIKIVGLADANESRLQAYAEEFGVPESACFTDANTMFEAGIEADGAVICTMDQLHYTNAMTAMKQGYHLMLEKPVALRAEECVAIRDYANEHGLNVVVCHVLRYTPFYQKIKEIIDSGMIGEVCTIQAMERVEYWHMAHSYVRGNWRCSEQSSPMILAKACHDTDILLWLCGKKCKSVSSFGSLKYFGKKDQPEGAADRCLACRYVDDCPYSAKLHYIEEAKKGRRDWPLDVVAKNPTPEALEEALKTSPYGKCVYLCDNNVVDHQILNLWMEDDVAISFTMSSFNTKSGRMINIMATHGNIYADMGDNVITLDVFGKTHEVIDVNKLATEFNGHGGGDDRLFEDFITLLREGRSQAKTLTDINRSVESHFICLAAEQSRVHGGEVVTLS
ncbi:MAG: Gfo/Idh/MocA family oxidoreductase [Clostridiales bacterium]|nr:Gfo/Idh/MocA family oxidoreductase [Clostridiales bacterium]